MRIQVRGAREHNLKAVDVEIGDGLTAVTGISGSGKTSLVFDTLYHEAQRRFLEVYARGAAAMRMAPAHVDQIEGLGPAVAVGQNLLNRNPGSSLASAAGLHPFARLLFAHFGTRSCPGCGNEVSFFTREEAAIRLMELAARPTLAAFPVMERVSGSHIHLLGLLEQIFGREAIVVDGRVWDGSALEASKEHTIRLVKGQVEVQKLGEARELLDEAASMGCEALWVANETIRFTPVCGWCGTCQEEIRPTDFHGTCNSCVGAGCDKCRGSGLPPAASGVHWQGLDFRSFMAQTVEECGRLLLPVSMPSWRLQEEFARRLGALEKVGLGYLALDRPAPSLSRGEAQRVRLALTLVSRLEDLIHILAEPTVGLHPADVERLLPVFRELAGPVVFVEHDRAAVAQADQVIDIGPGAGAAGGEVVFQGAPAELWKSDTHSGEWFSLRKGQALRRSRPAPVSFIQIFGASLHNLREIDVRFPTDRLTAVSGVSGSGKSTLVEDVLAATLGSEKPVGCLKIEGPRLKVELVDQSPIGKNPRSNPATYTGLADLVRDLFSRATGLGPAFFSFNRPEGACPECDGLGAIEARMRYLPSSWVRCEQCQGRRFSEEVLSATVELQGRWYSVADFMDLSAAEALTLIQKENWLSQAEKSTAVGILSALVEIGLGYLPLGQPSVSLSGGEAQRVKLARHLGKRSLAGKLLILDEPSTGLHPYDLAGLLGVLHRLSAGGATIVVVEHHLDVLRAADWIIDLGPGAGQQGGQVLYEGPVAGLLEVAESKTAIALRGETDLAPRESRSPLAVRKHDAIEIRAARSNNLKTVDLDIPKGALTVVSGLSGSGKSSLVRDVLEVEARRRYLETLTMYERQGEHENRAGEVDSISGLGVTVRAAPERLAYSRRATVGVLSEISYHLAGMMAVMAERTCLICGMRMEKKTGGWTCSACGATAGLAIPQHFLTNTYASACLNCNGVGSLQQPNPRKLIIAPQKPVCGGAMYSPGFFPDGYLGKPGNGGYYLLQALGHQFGFDPHQTPWNEMSEEAQQAFLFGSKDELEVDFTSRNGRTSRRKAKFPGFYGFVRDWDVGNTYTDNIDCPVCGGARLRPEYLSFNLGGKNIHQMNQIPLVELWSHCLQFPEEARESGLVSNSLRLILRRLEFLNRVGLGYMNLLRPAGTLSAGEVQRIRLAGLLGGELTALTVLLDEPTRGLHPAEVEALGRVLLELRTAGNTLVVVEHDLEILRIADHLVEMGPETGARGGCICAQGSPTEVAKGDSVSAAWLRDERTPFVPGKRRKPGRWMALRGARANNLKGEDAKVPLGVLCGVCGLSGSGKSTLVMDTLGRILAPRKQTTSVAYEPIEPGEYDGLDGAPARTILLDQSRSGIHSPANWLGIQDGLQILYAESQEAQALGLSLADLTARCPGCGGSGEITTDLAFLPDLHEPCDACRGSGYLADAWHVHIQGVALADVFQLTIAEVNDLFGSDERISRLLKVALEVGLGYLVLRQPGRTLSGGEAQRLKIARELSRRFVPGTLYILDEPTIGQHLEDVSRLVRVLLGLVEAGGSVLVVEHHPHLLAACDWLIELGPGGGPEGGHVIATGTPEDLAGGTTPIAPYLRAILEQPGC